MKRRSFLASLAALASWRPWNAPVPSFIVTETVTASFFGKSGDNFVYGLEAGGKWYESSAEEFKALNEYRKRIGNDKFPVKWHRMVPNG